MELDLIRPRPQRLICTPFRTATRVLRKEKKGPAYSGCHGILSYNNLTSRCRKTVFICDLTLWKCSVMLLYIRSLLISVELCSLLFFFSFFRWTSCKTGNHDHIKSLLLLVPYCIHYLTEFLHLWCIPAVQWELQRITRQQKSYTVPGFNGGFVRLLRSLSSMWSARIIVGGEHFIRSNWGQTFSWDQKQGEQKPKGLQVV